MFFDQKKIAKKRVLISAVVLSKNNEDIIKKCLKQLLWCDEIILMDDYSTDKTVKIAKEMGAKVIKRKLNNDFSSQRNFALKLTRNNWVFFVDSDEIVSSSLKKEIIFQLSVVDKETKGFYFNRNDFIFGRWLKYGENSRVKFLRLGQKKSGCWEKNVHEVWQIKGKKRKLKNPLIHIRKDTWEDMVNKIYNYSQIRAQELYKTKGKSNWFLIILYPFCKFFLNFFLRLGFLDGIPGLMMAVLMSFHSYLNRSMLYFLNKNE